MKCLLCAVAVVLVTTGGPVLGDEKALPKGVPPRVVSVSKVDEKAGVIEYREAFTTLPIPDKNGPVKEGDPAGVPIALGLFVTVKFSLKDGAVYDVSGKKVNAAAAVKRLSVGDIVLVAGGYEPVDPAYLKVFTKDVLILVHPIPKPVELPKPNKNDR
jgi:hypothetical protein